jgi:hypothetical protein
MHTVILICTTSCGRTSSVFSWLFKTHSWHKIQPGLRVGGGGAEGGGGDGCGAGGVANGSVEVTVWKVTALITLKRMATLKTVAEMMLQARVLASVV